MGDEVADGKTELGLVTCVGLTCARVGGAIVHHDKHVAIGCKGGIECGTAEGGEDQDVDGRGGVRQVDFQVAKDDGASQEVLGPPVSTCVGWNTQVGMVVKKDKMEVAVAAMKTVEEALD